MAEDKEPTAEEPPKKKSKLLLFVLIGVVLAGGGAAAAFLMTKDKKAADAVEDSAATRAPAAEEKAGLVPLDTFLVNLNDPAGERYMKVTMRLTIAPESVADKTKDDELQLARIRDRVLTVLMSKTFAELSDPLGKESLRFEIQGQVDTLLDQGAVQDVFFSEFVVQ